MGDRLDGPNSKSSSGLIQSLATIHSLSHCQVEFAKADDPEKVETRILQLAEVQLEAPAEDGEGPTEGAQPGSSSGSGGVTRWRLANVRANRAAAGKGRGLTKKQREAVFEIPVASLRRVNLHLDI